MNRGTIAEINLNALSGNLHVINELSKGRPAIAVVKADAYGHGAVEVSRRLVRDGIKYLAVAFTEEAKALRDAGITAQVLVLFDPDIGDIFKYNLVPVISSKGAALALSKEAERAGKEVGVHIKVDTGMGRLGLTGSDAGDIAAIADLKNIRIDGIMSHFSEADLADISFAQVQMEKFSNLRQALSAKGLKIKLFHIANSAAVITLPDSHFDAVRPGLMLYGYSPLNDRDASCVMRHEIKDKDNESFDASRITHYASRSFDASRITHHASRSFDASRITHYASRSFDASRITHHALRSLIPVMTVKARIIALRKLSAGAPISYGRTFITQRDSLIGVVSAGYADGFDRRFSNNATMLVRGKRVPVVGRVCMDLSMIDVTDAGGVQEGDEAVILGRQGNESLDASDLAFRAGTIPYEILLSLGSRARRVYHG